MEFNEYFIDLCKRLENEGGAIIINCGGETFNVTKHCFFDYHDDFIYIRDKKSRISMCTRYDAISSIYYKTEDDMEAMAKEVSEDLIKKVISEKLGDLMD